MSASDVESALRSEGHRVTGPRLAVWRALTESDGHLTAEELAGHVEAIDPTVNVASVYRSLGLFEELGIARQSQLGDGGARWEIAHPDEHFHMVCRACGTVDHHRGSLVQAVTDHLAGHGFQAEQVELIVTGLCTRCVVAS
ncbi:Fur family transcriptional regulator [Euzebya tangerina]|uniref:Fur family transcriptional regulator n=1 Tax=Euzebya tangerina TaxID=591198 RepID=UPI000E3193F4|nr:Fur family transcriptional regulator [Euzebya tangerina]